MNICIVGPGYPYQDVMFGVFIKQLVVEWADMGHHCVVIAPQSWTTAIRGKSSLVPKYFQDKTDKGNFIDVYHPTITSLGWKSYAGYSPTLIMERLGIESVLKHCNNKFDAIYCHFFVHAFECWKYATRHKIPLFMASGESTIPRIGAPCRSFSIEKFLAIVRGQFFVSTKNLDEARDLGYLNENVATVIPNSVNLFKFKKIDKKYCRNQLQLNPNDFITITVGELCLRKGQDRVQSAIEKLGYKDIKSLYIGKGALELLGDNIIYKGSVNNELLPLYLNAADVFILPTLREGCCNAIVEAMACGLPIISSDLAFNHDVLTKDNSLLVDPMDVDAISDALNILYNTPELREKLSEAVYHDAQDLSIQKRAVKIMNYIANSL